MAEVPGAPLGGPPEFNQPQPPTGPEGPQGGSLVDPTRGGVPELPGGDVPQRFGFHSTGRRSESLPYGGPMMSSTGPEDPGTRPEPTPPGGLPELPADNGVPTPPRGGGRHALVEGSEDPTPPMGEEATAPDEPDRPGRHRLREEVNRFNDLLPDVATIEDKQGEPMDEDGKTNESAWSETILGADGQQVVRRVSYSLTTEQDENGNHYNMTLVKRAIGFATEGRRHERAAWTVDRTGDVASQRFEIIEIVPSEGPDTGDLPVQRTDSGSFPNVDIPTPRESMGETLPKPPDLSEPRVVSKEEADRLIATFDDAVVSGFTEGARINDPYDTAELIRALRMHSRRIAESQDPEAGSPQT